MKLLLCAVAFAVALFLAPISAFGQYGDSSLEIRMLSERFDSLRQTSSRVRSYNTVVIVEREKKVYVDRDYSYYGPTYYPQQRYPIYNQRYGNYGYGGYGGYSSVGGITFIPYGNNTYGGGGRYINQNRRYPRRR